MGFFDAISGFGDLISGRSSQRKITQMQIDASKEMNERNVAAQEAINAANVASAEKINQSQIDFQQGINDMMRYDSKHAISDKKADLIRAGYSMADPSLQGFSAASLGGISPQMAQQVAPQVQSEFDGSAAANSIAARNSSINAILSAASTASTIALQKAQTRSQNANATGQELENVWTDVKNQAALEETYGRIAKLVADKKVSDNTAAKVLKEIDLFDKQIEIAIENIAQLKFTTAHQAEQFKAQIDNLRAATDDLIASKDLKEQQAAVAKAQAAYQEIKNEFARVGINFDDNNVLSSLLKLAHKGQARLLTNEVFAAIGDIVAGFGDSIAQPIADMLEALGSAAVRGTKKAVKAVFD